MLSRKSPASPRLRLLTVMYGLIVFLWLMPEDHQVWPVTGLGVGLALLVVTRVTLRRLGGRPFPPRYLLQGAVLLGALVGLGANLAAVGLMFFKNALHAHLFLDYPVGLMGAMLARGPGWALAGGLVGLGAAFIQMIRLTTDPYVQPDPDQKNAS